VRENVDRLRQEVAELRASRARLVRRADADRRALERELHDGLQQQLVGAAADLALARRLVDDDQRSLVSRLEAIAGDVRRALDEAAKLAHRLYPPLLESGGLAAALRAAAATLGIRVRVHAPADGEYPPEVAGAVYFCCVDLLEQVPPDMEATITLRDDDGVLVFDVATPGTAVPDEIRDRIEALGGNMRLDGTGVSGSLPLSR
jgi:signal transduction histidine kinase